MIPFIISDKGEDNVDALFISILSSYGINEFFIKNGDNIEIIILKRNRTLKASEWLNLYSAIRYKYRKEVVFLLKKEAIKLYKNLNNFSLIKGE